MYVFLRIHARSIGVVLPEITEEQATAYMHGNVERVRGLNRSHNGNISLVDTFSLRWEKVCADEPQLKRAFKEITRYIPDPEYLFAGAAQVYLPLKQAVNIDRLNVAFQLPGEFT